MNGEMREAAKTGDLSRVIRLIKRGILEEDKSKMLTVACAWNHIDIVKFLCENGADIHHNHDYPMEIARQECHDEIVNYLKGRG